MTRFPSALYMSELFNSRSNSQLKNLAKFIRLIMLQFSQHKEKEDDSKIVNVNTVGPTRTRSGRVIKKPTFFGL